MRTDRRTDMTQLIVDFRNFANAPKNRFSVLGMKPLFLDGSADSLVIIRTELYRSINQDKQYVT